MHWHTDSCNFEWNFTRKTGSMSRKGNCWDNAVAESFFKTIKIESVYNETYQNHDHAPVFRKRHPF